MKATGKILLFCLFTILILSCQLNTGKQRDKHREIQIPGQVHGSVTCTSDPSITYAIYIPKGFNPGKRYPLILAFDPHSSGLIPVNRYKELSEQFGFILAASNDSKNGQTRDMTEKIFQALMTDIRTTYPIDTNRIYLMGFSGGARVAGMMAMLHPGIRGVIACGAGLPGLNPMPEIKFEFFGIAGLGDFNLNEMLQLNQALDQSAVRHFLITFEGLHEWPPVAYINDAILWFNQEGKPELSLPEKKAAGLKNDPGYIKQQKYREQILKSEEAEQQMLMGALFSKDIAWWKARISTYVTEIKKGKDPEVVWRDQRLLGFLSLFCYSNANAALNQDNREMAEKVIRIYEMSDPQNPEPNYLQAMLCMRNNDTTTAMFQLEIAIGKGFKDKSRALQQREFEDQQSNKIFFDLLQKMK